MKGHTVSSQPGIFDELRRLPEYREVFMALTWKHFRLQYQSVLLGVIWGVVSPLLMSAIFFFALDSRLGEDFSNYFIFLYSGFFFWNVFTSSLNQAANCLIQEHNMLRKIYFPRFILPLSFISARLFDIVIAFGILTGLLIYFDIEISWPSYLVVTLMLVCCLILVTAGFCLSFSVLLVRFRGLQVVNPIIIQGIFFTSSVIYDGSLTIENSSISALFQLNPISIILKPIRQLIFTGVADVQSIFVAINLSIVIFLIGFVLFKTEDKTLIDRL